MSECTSRVDRDRAVKHNIRTSPVHKHIESKQEKLLGEGKVQVSIVLAWAELKQHNR